MVTSSLLALGALASVAAALPHLEYSRGDEFVFSHDPSGVRGGSPFAFAPEHLGAAYASGAVHHSLMSLFTDAVNRMSALGIFDDPVTHAPITEFTPCVGGYAGTKENNTFACRDLDLYTFLSHEALGSEGRLGSDIWGWAHEDGDGKTREFGLVGQYEGTAFVEIVGEGQVVYLGRLPTQSVGSIWRDIKVIGHYAYIGSEAEGHGIQVFDLTKVGSLIGARLRLLI
jgi:hypothetical protein